MIGSDAQVLLLDIVDFSAENRWSWQLTDPAGKIIAFAKVMLDKETAEYEGFVDLYHFLKWQSAPDRARSDRSELLAQVGTWVGVNAFGQIGTEIVGRARENPVVVRVRVPYESRALFARPFEIAHVGGAPLALQNVSLVFESADGTDANSSVVAVHGISGLRVLAIFSLPTDAQALNVRWERHKLEQLLHSLRSDHGAEVELKVVQYGVTRDRLAAVLGDPRGWDIVHISGHGLPGGLLLEDSGGQHDLIGTGKLLDLLSKALPRLKMVTLAACESAGAAQAAPLVELGFAQLWSPVRGLSGPALGAGGQAPSADPPLPTLASQMARRLGCAVLAMRYRVDDRFAILLTDRLYSRLLRDHEPLARALQLSLRDLAPRVPALAVATPALFGSAATSLAFDVPKSPHTEMPPQSGIEHLPAQPPQFVGRVALMTRASSALAPANALRGILLHGMPGVGKTACAIELAYTHRDSFDRIVWHAVSREDGAAELAQQKLRPTADSHRGLIVLDGLDQALDDDGEFRDPAWVTTIESLVTPGITSRLIVTSRRPLPLAGERWLVEPISPLLPIEGALACIELEGFRALALGHQGLSDEQTSALMAYAVWALGGHPLLTEAVARRFGVATDLVGMLDASDLASATAERIDASTFAGEDKAGMACIRDIEQWTLERRRSLPEHAAMLLDVLCIVEDADCGDFGGKMAWGKTWEKVRPSEPVPDFETAVQILHDAGLVEIFPSEQGRFRMFRVQSCVAATSRSAAPPELHLAVNEWMALFLFSFHVNLLPYEQTGQGDLLRDMTPRAVPYLVRSNQLGDASDLLMAMLARDHSPESVRHILPMLRRLADMAAGTSAELRQRAYVARAESIVSPALAETTIRDLLHQAENENRSGMILPLLHDMVRVLRDAGQLDEAIVCLNKGLDIARAENLGPWVELFWEADQLQTRVVRGEAEPVLARIQELVPVVAALPEAEVDHEDRDTWGNRRETAGTRELIFHTGMLAASELGRWAESLDFAVGVDEIQARRNATALERAHSRVNTYRALAGLGRLAEARDLLRACREIFAASGETDSVANATGALADIESRLGHVGLSIRLHVDALRQNYRASQAYGAAVSHANLARLLRRPDRDGKIPDPRSGLAHQMAAALIDREVRLGTLDHNLEILAGELRRYPDPAAVPQSFDELCRVLQAIEGADLNRLLGSVRSSFDGPTAFAELLHQVRQRAGSAPTAEAFGLEWEPVLAALVAAEASDRRAQRWLDSALTERSGAWPSLTAALNRMRSGADTATVVEGLDPVSAGIARRAADALAGRIAIDARHDMSWRVLDYVASGGRDHSAAEIRALIEAITVGDGDPPARARFLFLAAERFVDLRAPTDALSAWKAAVVLYRQLANAEPFRYDVDLATCLGRLSSQLEDLGLRGEAEAIQREALAISRRLATVDPEQYEFDLASKLNNAGSLFTRSGLLDEAFQCFQESVDILRRRASGGAVESVQALATALRNYGGALLDGGQTARALEATEEAITHGRELARRDPAEFGASLVAAVTALAHRLRDAGETERAVDTAREAVELCESMEAANPAAFPAERAMATNMLSLCLSAAGRDDESLTLTQQAVELLRRLPASGGHEADLALTLSRLAPELSRRGQRDEALAAAQEAVTLLTRLTAADASAYERYLAGALNNRAAVFSALDQPDEAATDLRHAVAIYDSLGTSEIHRVRDDLAMSLGNLGSVLAAAKKWREVLPVADRTVGLLRQLAETSPGGHELALARCLDRLATAHFELSLPSDGTALAMMREAVEILSRLDEQYPDRYSNELGRAKLTMGFLNDDARTRRLDNILTISPVVVLPPVPAFGALNVVPAQYLLVPKVAAANWSPDGRRLATTGGDHFTRIWSVADGICQECELTLTGHNEAVWTVAWSPDGTQVATASDDKTVRIWSIESGRCLHVLGGHEDLVFSVAWSPDGRYLATVDFGESVLIWRTDDGQLVRKVESYGVMSAAWSPAGDKLATASARNLGVIWPTTPDGRIRVLYGHDDGLMAVAWSPDGQHVVTTSDDRTARTWRADSGALVATLTGHTAEIWSVAWCPDGRHIATGSHDATARIWDANSGELLQTVDNHDDKVTSVAWSPDGRVLATASGDDVQLWKVFADE